MPAARARRRHRHALGDEVPRRPRHVDRRRGRRLRPVPLGQRQLPGDDRAGRHLRQPALLGQLRRVRLRHQAARRGAAQPRRRALALQRVPAPARAWRRCRCGWTRTSPTRRRSPSGWTADDARELGALRRAARTTPTTRWPQQYLPKGPGAVFSLRAARAAARRARRSSSARRAVLAPRQRRRHAHARHPPGLDHAPPALRARRSRPRACCPSSCASASASRTSTTSSSTSTRRSDEPQRGRDRARTWTPPGARERRRDPAPRADDRGRRRVGQPGAREPLRAHLPALVEHRLRGLAGHAATRTRSSALQAYPSLADLPGDARHRRRLPPRRRPAGRRARRRSTAGAGAFWMQLGLHSDEAVRDRARGRARRRHQPLREDRARALPRRAAPRGLRHRRDLLEAHAWLTELVLDGRPDARVRRDARAGRGRLRDATATPRAPVVFVCHALTGDAEAAVWWDTLVGPGKPVDTDRFFVICANLLGGCQGTTGPSSIEPRDRRAVRPRLPALHRPRPRRACTARCCARSASSGCTRRSAARSAACRSLQWALDHPDEIERAVLVCASARLTAQNIALLQGRRAHAILATATTAMAVARMMAHITYLSEEGMELQVRPRARGADGPMTMALRLRGRALPRPPGRDLPRPLRPAAPTSTCRGSWTTSTRSRSGRCAAPDTRFLARLLQQRLALRHRALARHRARAARRSAPTSRHVEIASPWGHDSFLMDVPGYQELVADFLA